MEMAEIWIALKHAPSPTKMRRSQRRQKLMAANRQCAYVTLLTKSSYLAGVLVLDYSLRAVKAGYPLVVMITPSLPQQARNMLHKRSIRTIEVSSLSPPARHTLASHDARFLDTWTKLRCGGRFVEIFDIAKLALRGFGLTEFKVHFHRNYQRFLVHINFLWTSAYCPARLRYGCLEEYGRADDPQPTSRPYRCRTCLRMQSARDRTLSN